MPSGSMSKTLNPLMSQAKTQNEHADRVSHAVIGVPGLV